MTEASRKVPAGDQSMTEASDAVRTTGRSAPLARIARLLALAPKGLVRFLTVGVGGLFVDVAVLWIAEQAGSGPVIGRAVSLSVATLATWALNRQFTFGESGRRARSEFGRYALVALVAQGVNYSLFQAVVHAAPHLNHSLVAVAGAVVATGFSYTGQRFFTFAPDRNS
jgi:putative flippase GtrA